MRTAGPSAATRPRRPPPRPPRRQRGREAPGVRLGRVEPLSQRLDADLRPEREVHVLREHLADLADVVEGHEGVDKQDTADAASDTTAARGRLRTRTPIANAGKSFSIAVKTSNATPVTSRMPRPRNEREGEHQEREDDQVRVPALDPEHDGGEVTAAIQTAAATRVSRRGTSQRTESRNVAPAARPSAVVALRPSPSADSASHSRG